MKFRTEFIPVKADFQLDPHHPITLIGSCFSDNIGRILTDHAWDARVNPCGTLFNPASIARVIELAGATDPEMEISGSDGYFFSFDFPTRFAASSPDESRSRIISALGNLYVSIQESQAIAVTLGTAMIFPLISTGKIVANCHKLPSHIFSPSMLSLEDTYLYTGRIVSAIRLINPGIHIIFTVSPVRYLSRGFAENSRSKSRLILACEKECHDSGVSYFPAYEILNDDLRSYRFYASDLIHPSEDAAKYISEMFFQTYLDRRSIEILRQAYKVNRRFAHRPENPDEYNAFSSESRRLVSDFLKNHPGFKFRENT